MEQNIKVYRKAKLISVRKSDRCIYPDWTWREEFLGKTGILEVHKNSYNTKRKYYFCFECAELEDILTSGDGEMSIDKNKVIFTTRNSVYEFDIGGEYTCKNAEQAVTEHCESVRTVGGKADLSSAQRKTDCRCINASSVNHKKRCSRRWICIKKISKVLNCAKITA